MRGALHSHRLDLSVSSMGTEWDLLLDFWYIIGHLMARLMDSVIVCFIFSVTMFDWFPSGTSHSVQLYHLFTPLCVCVCACVRGQ